MKRYKIVNRRRFGTFIIVNCSLIFLIAFLIVNSIKAQGAVLSQKYQEYKILEGDTLWNIALEYKPNKYDVRKMVFEIKSFNKMDTSYIFPGDIIKIPLIKTD